MFGVAEGLASLISGEAWLSPSWSSLSLLALKLRGARLWEPIVMASGLQQSLLLAWQRLLCHAAPHTALRVLPAQRGSNRQHLPALGARQQPAVAFQWGDCPWWRFPSSFSIIPGRGRCQ